MELNKKAKYDTLNIKAAKKSKYSLNKNSLKIIANRFLYYSNFVIPEVFQVKNS